MSSPVEDEVKGLYSSIKELVEIKIQQFRLDLVDKISHLTYLLFLFLILLILASIFLAFASLTLAKFLGDTLGNLLLGYGIISCMYLIIIILLIIFRKRWLLDPVLRQIAAILLPSKDEAPDD